MSSPRTTTVVVKGETKRYQPRSVLGGAYRGDQEERATLNHAIEVDEEGLEIGDKTLCRKLAAEKLVDVFGMSEDDEVTCPACVARLAKLTAKKNPAAVALDKKALWREIEKDARDNRRSVLAELRDRLKIARESRRASITSAKSICRTAKADARARARKLESDAKATRAAARGTCDAGKAQATTARTDVLAARAARDAELAAQRDARRIDQIAKSRAKPLRSSSRERAAESDEHEEYERALKANPSGGGLILLGLCSRVEYKPREGGRSRVIRWADRHAPLLAYETGKGRGSLHVVYPVTVVGKSSRAAAQEYAKTHWGRTGAGERIAGDVALAPLTELGECVSITYTTEKGGDAAPVYYEHEFGDGAKGEWTAPTLLEHRCGAPRCAHGKRVALRGGTYSVTTHGIVG